MKKSLAFIACVAALTLASGRSLAADKEVTISGEGKCGKCALKETKACQNVIEVTKDGKKETYYLVGDVSKKFHDNLCQESKKVTAVGTVKEANGKKELMVSKIELAK
jgi:hypothetical protein